MPPERGGHALNGSLLSRRRQGAFRFIGVGEHHAAATTTGAAAIQPTPLACVRAEGLATSCNRVHGHAHAMCQERDS